MPAESLEASVARMRAATQELGLSEKEAAATEVTLALLDIWGITIAALIGRGLIEGDNLRRNLLGMIAICRQEGCEVRAATIETVANNIPAMVAAVDLARKYPPPSGRA